MKNKFKLFCVVLLFTAAHAQLVFFAYNNYFALPVALYFVLMCFAYKALKSIKS